MLLALVIGFLICYYAPANSLDAKASNPGLALGGSTTTMGDTLESAELDSAGILNVGGAQGLQKEFSKPGFYDGSTLPIINVIVPSTPNGNGFLGDVWLIIFAGLFGLAGPILTLYIQHLKAKDRVLVEESAKQKVLANAKAYGIMKRVEGEFSFKPYIHTFSTMLGLQEWLIDNTVFLPQKYCAKWYSIRNHVAHLARDEKMPDKKYLSDEKKKSYIYSINIWISEALQEVLAEMNMKPIVPEKALPLDPPHKEVLFDNLEQNND
ncbi:MAG: hypothetical protein ABIK96_07655 [bacterium]